MTPPQRNGSIYALFTNSDPERIRYVGQTRQKIENRIRGHFGGANPTLPVSRWVKKHGKVEIGFRVLSTPPLALLDAEEVSYISKFKEAGMCDLNMTTGGQAGYFYTDEVKARMSEATKAQMTPERRAQLSRSAIAQGFGAARLGAHFSSEHRSKISAATRGKTGLDGESNPGAKLTAKDAAEIYALKGVRASTAVSAEYEVSFYAVLNIWNGRSWNSVTGEPRTRKPSRKQYPATSAHVDCSP